jgi:phage head maturation protease
VIASRVTERAAPIARVEWRMSGVPENKTIRGYAAMFNSMSYDLGGFREVIAPGAFSNVLATNPDVRLLYNHDDAAVWRAPRAARSSSSRTRRACASGPVWTWPTPTCSASFQR